MVFAGLIIFLRIVAGKHFLLWVPEVGEIATKIVDKYFYEICCKIRKKCIFAEIGE